MASGSGPSIKVYYPRMLISLKEELIKEVVCGHSHCFAIAVNGTIFAWGQNASGELGLGDIAPPVVRKPVAIPDLSNV